MKKQILSISLAAALAVSCTGIAMAEDKTPTVFGNQALCCIRLKVGMNPFRL